MSENKKRGCMKNGCFGCLGVLGLALVLGVVLGGLQFVGSRRPVDKVVEEKSRPLPALPLATAAQLEDATGIALATPAVRQDDRPVAGRGTLDLDLQMGEFVIVPGEIGSEIEIEAEYDRTRFKLVEELVEDDDGDWTYRVRLAPRLRILGFSNQPNRIEIRLPRGRPLSLIGTLRMGQSDLELGGLWLDRVELDSSMGEHTISFSEPTAVPLDSFRLKGQMGQLTVRELGNASPASIEASHRMGEMSIDLDGAWQQDGEVAMRCQMGECSLSAPDGVRLVADRASVFMGGKSIRIPDPSSLPEDAPTLHLDLRGTMGEIRVR